MRHYVLCLITLLHLQIPRAIPSHTQHYAPPPLGQETVFQWLPGLMLLGPRLKHQQRDVGLGRAEHKILQQLLRTGTFLLSRYIFE